MAQVAQIDYKPGATPRLALSDITGPGRVARAMANSAEKVAQANIRTVEATGRAANYRLEQKRVKSELGFSLQLAGIQSDVDDVNNFTEVATAVMGALDTMATQIGNHEEQKATLKYNQAIAQSTAMLESTPYRNEGGELISNSDRLVTDASAALDEAEQIAMSGVTHHGARTALEQKFAENRSKVLSGYQRTAQEWRVSDHRMVNDAAIDNAIRRGDVEGAREALTQGIDGVLYNPAEAAEWETKINQTETVLHFDRITDDVFGRIANPQEAMAYMEQRQEDLNDPLLDISSENRNAQRTKLNNQLSDYWIGEVNTILATPNLSTPQARIDALQGLRSQLMAIPSGRDGFVTDEKKLAMANAISNADSNLRKLIADDKARITAAREEVKLSESELKEQRTLKKSGISSGIRRATWESVLRISEEPGMDYKTAKVLVIEKLEDQYDDLVAKFRQADPTIDADKAAREAINGAKQSIEARSDIAKLRADLNDDQKKVLKERTEKAIVSDRNRRVNEAVTSLESYDDESINEARGNIEAQRAELIVKYADAEDPAGEAKKTIDAMLDTLKTKQAYITNLKRIEGEKETAQDKANKAWLEGSVDKVRAKAFEMLGNDRSEVSVQRVITGMYAERDALVEQFAPYTEEPGKKVDNLLDDIAGSLRKHGEADRALYDILEEATKDQDEALSKGLVNHFLAMMSDDVGNPVAWMNEREAYLLQYDQMGWVQQGFSDAEPWLQTRNKIESMFSDRVAEGKVARKEARIASLTTAFSDGNIRYNPTLSGAKGTEQETAYNAAFQESLVKGTHNEFLVANGHMPKGHIEMINGMLGSDNPEAFRNVVVDLLALRGMGTQGHQMYNKTVAGLGATEQKMMDYAIDSQFRNLEPDMEAIAAHRERLTNSNATQIEDRRKAWDASEGQTIKKKGKQYLQTFAKLLDEQGIDLRSVPPEVVQQFEREYRFEAGFVPGERQGVAARTAMRKVLEQWNVNSLTGQVRLMENSPEARVADNVPTPPWMVAELNKQLTQAGFKRGQADLRGMLFVPVTAEGYSGTMLMDQDYKPLMLPDGSDFFTFQDPVYYETDAYRKEKARTEKEGKARVLAEGDAVLAELIQMTHGYDTYTEVGKMLDRMSPNPESRAQFARIAAYQITDAATLSFAEPGFRTKPDYAEMEWAEREINGRLAMGAEQYGWDEALVRRKKYYIMEMLRERASRKQSASVRRALRSTDVPALTMKIVRAAEDEERKRYGQPVSAP